MNLSHDLSAIATSEMSASHIQGEITGDLYTQVQRRSSSCDSPIPNSEVEEFSSSSHSQSVSNRNGHISVQCMKSSKTVTHTRSFSSSMFSYSQTFSSHFGDSDHGELFSEILSKINDKFRSSLSDDQAEDEDHSNGNTDTAYNSTCCSENSSLDRKTRIDQDDSLHCLDVDCFSQGTDCQVTPLEEYNHMLSSDIQNSNIDQSNSNINNQSNCDMEQNVDNESVSLNNSLNQTKQSNLTKESPVICDSSEKPARDQCDSAIFESESILDDVSEGREGLIRKIEQLRTHLVELKKNR